MQAHFDSCRQEHGCTRYTSTGEKRHHDQQPEEQQVDADVDVFDSRALDRILEGSEWRGFVHRTMQQGLVWQALRSSISETLHVYKLDIVAIHERFIQLPELPLMELYLAVRHVGSISLRTLARVP